MQQARPLVPGGPHRTPPAFPQRACSSSQAAPKPPRFAVRYMSERSRRDMLLDNLSQPDTPSPAARASSAAAAPTVHHTSPDSLQQQPSTSPRHHAGNGHQEQQRGAATAGPPHAQPGAPQPAGQGSAHTPMGMAGASMPRPTMGTYTQQQSSDTDGWGDVSPYPSSSSDDGGWGESPSVHDWSEAAQYPQSHTHHTSGSYAGQQPQQTYTSGTNGQQPSSDSAWDAGPPPYGAPYSTWQQAQQPPSMGPNSAGGTSTSTQYGGEAYGAQPGFGYQQPPYVGDNVPMGEAATAGMGAGAPAYEWQFFADGTRPGAGPQAQWGPSGAGMGGPDAQPPPGPQQPSDVTLLSRTEMDAVLPMTPTGRQAEYFRPHTVSERVVQLVGSLGASMLLSKSTVLAAPALLYPLWSPWIRAALKNVEVYGNQLKTLGLWRAQVLEVQVMANNTFRPGWSAGRQRSSLANGAVVRLLMGDPWEGGARVQLEFPYQPKAELLRPGEAVEALVLAKDAQFYAFKVIREVYAPGLGLWLTEYPFVDRAAFLDVSLQIERSRQAEPEAAWGAPAEPPPHTYVVDVDITEPTQSWDYAPPDTADTPPLYTSSTNSASNSNSNGSAGYGSSPAAGPDGIGAPFRAAEAAFSSWGAQAAAGFSGFQGLPNSQVVQEQLGSAVDSMAASVQGAGAAWGGSMAQAWDSAAATAAAAAGAAASSAGSSWPSTQPLGPWGSGQQGNGASSGGPHEGLREAGAWPQQDGMRSQNAGSHAHTDIPTGWDDAHAAAGSTKGMAGTAQQPASSDGWDQGWGAQQQQEQPSQRHAAAR